MFEEYLKDSHEFYTIAVTAKSCNEIDKARRYFRISIICAFSALEAFVNYTAKSFEEADNLDRLEISFLNDKEMYFSVTQGVKTRTKYNPIEEKLKVLVKRFVPDYNFTKEVTWNNLITFKNFRDSLIHSRVSEDETILSDYNRQIILGFSAIIGVMNMISTGMYKKPLRKSILDLIPE